MDNRLQVNFVSMIGTLFKNYNYVLMRSLKNHNYALVRLCCVTRNQFWHNKVMLSIYPQTCKAKVVNLHDFAGAFFFAVKTCEKCAYSLVYHKIPLFIRSRWMGKCLEKMINVKKKPTILYVTCLYVCTYEKNGTLVMSNCPLHRVREKKKKNLIDGIEYQIIIYADLALIY